MKNSVSRDVFVYGCGNACKFCEKRREIAKIEEKQKLINANGKKIYIYIDEENRVQRDVTVMEFS